MVPGASEQNARPAPVLVPPIQPGDKDLAIVSGNDMLEGMRDGQAIVIDLHRRLNTHAPRVQSREAEIRRE
jgi:hypothetical protein